jgi:hypothetical protein
VALHTSIYASEEAAVAEAKQSVDRILSRKVS